MALPVSLSGTTAINQGAQTTLAATVTDADGNTITSGLTYAWTASRGSFVGSTTGASVVYHADFTDTGDVNVTIRCNVTRAADSSPTISASGLTAMADLGITGQLVNIHATDSNAVSANTNNILFQEGSVGTIETGSDLDLAADLHIYRFRWDNRSGNTRFLLNDNGAGSLGNYFSGNTTQSVYIIFEDGTYFEIGNAQYGSGSGGFARWDVTDQDLIDRFNGWDGTENLLIGVADAGSVGIAADSGIGTATVTAAAIVALSIEAIDEQFIVIGTKDYDLAIDIGGNPDSVKPGGDFEGFYHDWDADTQRLHIKSDEITRLISGAIWTIDLAKGTDTLAAKIIYNVVPAAPIIEDPGAQTLYKGLPYSSSIVVANNPAVSRGRGLLTGLKSEPSTDADGASTIKTIGVLPRDVNLTETSFDVAYYAENDGGSDQITVPFSIEDIPPYIAALSRRVGSTKIRVFDTASDNAQVGSDIILAGVDIWHRLAMSGTLVAAVNDTDNIVRVFDLGNNNAQLGSDIDLVSQARWDYIAMFGTRIAVGNGNTDVVKVFDTASNNAQVGSDITFESGNVEGVAMSGSLVAVRLGALNVIRIFDTDNNNAQVGGDISLGSGTWLEIAMSGSLVAAFKSQFPVIVKVFDTADSNAQVGSDITPTGFWERSSMSNSLIGLLRISRGGHPGLIRIYDATDGSQVGSDISLPVVSATINYRDIVIFGSLVAVNNDATDIIKIYSIDTGLQVGDDIDLGTGDWEFIAMTVI